MYPEWFDKQSEMYKDWLKHWTRKGKHSESDLDNNLLRLFVEESQNQMQIPSKLLNKPIMQETKDDKAVKPLGEDKDSIGVQNQLKNEKQPQLQIEE